MKFSQLQLTDPYLKLDKEFYEQLDATPLEDAYVISLSQSAAELLGVDEPLELDEDLVKIINAEKKLQGSKSFAMCYAGHQFGHFAGRLGDGRAINLGKVNGFNLQVKGSGKTPYSRFGDGRAVLRSSIREYLVSEAMFGLGIETTRALALVGSQSDVARKEWEKGALVLRLSPTWVRFGTFEYFNARGEHEKLKELADYVIDESFAHLKGVENAYVKMYAQIVKNSAKTVAQWQSVGFNHGVLNTDNMAIDGRTIDYGPFAFLDEYDKYFVCNKTDSSGRYSFVAQPNIVHWNLERLAVALSPILNYEEALEQLEALYACTYEDTFSQIMYEKMGLSTVLEGDRELFMRLLVALERSRVDYTMFFRELSHFSKNKTEILKMCIDARAVESWLDAYTLRLEKEQRSDAERHESMLRVNPKYILKNHILQEAIEKAQEGDFTMIDELLKVAHEPYSEHLELEHLYRQTPLQARNIKLSCSS